MDTKPLHAALLAAFSLRMQDGCRFHNAMLTILQYHATFADCADHWPDFIFYRSTRICNGGRSEIVLPRNRWFNPTMEVKRSQKKKGYVRVWQDNVLILSGDSRKTLPKDFLCSQQGTKGMYQGVEFGITANTRAAIFRCTLMTCS